MSEITPITREEKLWNGEDLEPITREEMYIKHIFDKTQTIPDKPITRKEILMEKAGEGGGGDVTIKQLTATENGTYSEEGTAYSPVIVNVPDVPPVLDELTVTENGTYTPPSGTDGYNEVTVSVPLPENVYYLKEVEDLPQAIASFDDGSDLPMPKLEVAIEPQQDLHGYDSPWVGGAGKNKLNPDIRKYSSPYAVWGGILSSNVPNGDLTLDAGTYIFSMNESVKQISVRDNPDSVIVRVYNTNVMTFTIDQRKAVKIAIELNSGQDISKLNFQLERGSTATTFAPYSNICPISGFTEANVVVSPTTDAEDGTTYTIQFKDGLNPLTVYGSTLDVVSGELKVVPYYASYNGETLEGEWISDRDVYAVGTTPTIGAQVVNIGATPQSYQLTPTQVKSLLGTNNVWADTGDIEELEYFSKEA